MRRLIFATLLCAACATTKSVTTPEPRARFQTFDTTSPISDFDAASYYGIVIDGERLGEVAVWSNGAFTVEEDGERIPILELTLLARNESRTPFELHLESTGVVLTQSIIATIPAEHAVAGTLQVSPGETRRLGLRYRLPNEAAIADTQAFDFNWSVRTASSSFAQVTPFRLLPLGQFELGSEWPQTKRISYTRDNRRPWSIRWSAVTPEEGDQPVLENDEPPPFRWKAPPAKAEEPPSG